MKEKLTHITDNEFYVVDSLTHSIPYLVPCASALLDTIGSNFLDSLTAKGLNPNQVIVTSVLRTENDVETPPPSQPKCFGKLGTLLRSHFRRQLETLQKGRRQRRTSLTGRKLRYSETRSV